MEKKLTIALDAMGGDNAPSEIVKGAMLAIAEHSDMKVILVGDETAIQNELKQYQYDQEQVEVIHTTEEITCHESPVAAIRAKKDSSMVVALNQVKEGNADAFISAGSSGAILAGGLFVVGRIKGVERAPLGCLFPTAKGASMLVDCGANVDSKASQLVQYAKMGSIYMKHVMGVENPKVGLVNIGTEEEKGNALTKETYPLLKACTDINFIGNVEARELPAGEVDVAVCEAFTGNAILKTFEGTGKVLMKELKGAMMKGTLSKIGALLIKKNLKEAMKKFDATEHGGAPLLGLNGLVVKCHGNASHKEIKNAMVQCISFVEQDINGKIKAFLELEKTEKNASEE